MKPTKDINVTRGDVVVISPRKHQGSYADEDFTATVVKVKERFGETNGNFDRERTSKLLYLRKPGSTEDILFSNSYVTKIVSRDSRYYKENIFKESKIDENRFRQEKGIYIGSLMMMVSFILSKMDEEITTNLSSIKLAILFHKQKPGLLYVNKPEDRYMASDFVRVHKKPFIKWVKKNYRKFLFTKHEMDMAETEYNKSQNDAYFNSLDHMDYDWDSETVFEVIDNEEQFNENEKENDEYNLYT